VIGISLGDPAGIGIEITLKAFPKFRGQPITLVGSMSALQRTARKLQLPVPSGVSCVDIGFRPAVRFGRAQRAAGECALQSLETSTHLLAENRIDGIVTAPVSKEALRLAGFEFPGQTEFLAARLNARRHAMLAYAPLSEGRTLRIVFATIHCPIAEVPRSVTARLVAEKIRLLDDFLRRSENLPRPRIAVLALNPHAWEFTLGEEVKITRGIRLASGIRAEGPFPADSISFLLQRYDGIIAMYHDQAMIPAKLLAQGRGVNVTLGLPCVRTSPLHGTAFDIAGKGVASPASMEAAIELCLRLTHTIQQ
jgi:4-hydroxythreonine-4-phosphate dehydrogenase